MPISMLSLIFSGSNQSGTAHLAGVGHQNRYGKYTAAELMDLGMYQAISSATVYASSSCDATLIFFQPMFPVLPASDFNWKFMQITNRKNSGSELDVNLSAYGFNNKATSVLSVAANKGFEFRMSFRDLFLDQWNTMLDAELSGGAKRDGNPILTWSMWPQGISGLNSSNMYLKIHQNLNIELHCWPDYEAGITYYLHLYLDSGGHLRGYVAKTDYWVESGVKHGEIVNRLRPAVINGANTLDTELAKQLEVYSAFSFQDLYFLPGNQVSRAPTGIIHNQLTTSDVTIVVQL